MRLLFDTRDRGLRLCIIDALPAFAPTAREPVLLALAAVIQGETDPDVSRAAVAATRAAGVDGAGPDRWLAPELAAAEQLVRTHALLHAVQHEIGELA